MATMAEVAEHLDVSAETVRQLKQRGVLSSAARGQMDITASRVAYIRHLREQAAGRSSDAAEQQGLNLVKERARLANLQADRAEMQNAQLRGELVSRSGVSTAVTSMIEIAKSKLGRVPARIAKSDGKLKARVADAIEEALGELTLTRVEEQLGTVAGEEAEEPVA